MSLLPAPPPAYWSEIPWWAFVGLLLVVAIMTSPFAIQVVRGRGAAYASREQAFAQSRDGLEVQRREFLAALQTSEQNARGDLVRERSERAAERRWIEADRDEGWNLGRGMEDQAHWYRNEAMRVITRYNGLLAMFRDFVAGRLARERAEAILAEIVPMIEPPQVPMLRQVEPRTAPTS